MQKPVAAMDALIAELQSYSGIITKSGLGELNKLAVTIAEASNNRFDEYEAEMKSVLAKHCALADKELPNSNK